MLDGRIIPRDVVPNYDAAVARCLRDHRLPAARIPCVECQQNSDTKCRECQQSDHARCKDQRICPCALRGHLA